MHKNDENRPCTNLWDLKCSKTTTAADLLMTAMIPKQTEQLLCWVLSLRHCNQLHSSWEQTLADISLVVPSLTYVTSLYYIVENDHNKSRNTYPLLSPLNCGRNFAEKLNKVGFHLTLSGVCYHQFVKLAVSEASQPACSLCITFSSWQ